MALELPDYVIVAFNLIGLPWPGIDEDELRAWTRGVRQFADDVCDNSSQVNQTMRELADSSESSVIDAVAGEWERHHRLLTEFREPAYVFADALNVAADAVYAQKLVIIGAAAALVAEFTATQIGAIFSLGADEAAVPAEVISTRAIVKFALEELAGVILGKLINVAAGEITDHLNRTISGMLGGALQVGMEVQSLKLTPKAVSDVSRKLSGQASKVEESGGKAHAENTGRNIEDNSGHGGWSEVINALKQMLLEIAEGLFKNLPATISKVLGDIAEFILRFAEKVKAADEEGDPAVTSGNAKAADLTAGKAAMLRAGGGRARLPMSMDTVHSIASKYGIDISGNRIRIDKTKDGIRGSTAPNQSITLYRGAFENEEQLAKTLVHEQYHVTDLKAGLPYPKTYNAFSTWEQAAEDYASAWWDSLHN